MSTVKTVATRNPEAKMSGQRSSRSEVGTGAGGCLPAGTGEDGDVAAGLVSAGATGGISIRPPGGAIAYRERIRRELSGR
jgi:hypothetical protein